MTAQLIQHSSDTSPGGVVTYSIWIWSTVTARQVTASAVVSSRSMRQARFTLCPVSHRARCTIGRLPANQAVELTVTSHVRAKAKVGSALTLAVTAAAASLSPAQAAVTTVVGQAGQGSPAPTTNPIPPLPPSTLAPIPGSTITPAGLSGLFPTVTPSPSPPGKSGRAHRLAHATQASSALPLDPRLIGGQLAGLAVLAAAVTMVVARLSLRTPQTSAASASPAAPASPAQPSPAAASPAPASPALASPAEAGAPAGGVGSAGSGSPDPGDPSPAPQEASADPAADADAPDSSQTGKPGA